MRFRRAALLILVLLPLFACNRVSEPIAAPASTIDASISVGACETLARLGCALGQAADCADRIDLAVRQHHVAPEWVVCARDATSAPGLGACGPYFACAP